MYENPFHTLVTISNNFDEFEYFDVGILVGVIMKGISFPNRIFLK